MVKLELVIESCRLCPYSQCNDNGGWCSAPNRALGNPFSLHDSYILPNCPLPRIMEATRPPKTLEEELETARESKVKRNNNGNGQNRM